MSRRLLPLLVVALAAVLLVLLLDGGGKRHDGDRARGTPARVIRVVDGDTLVASNARETFYVRLLGIDTPETHRPGAPVECGGQEASASMRALVPPGTQVRLESDPGQDQVDRYGRQLDYVWLPDGRLLEKAQLESGWATTYVFEGRPVSLFPRLAAAARAAREAGRGAWSRCGGDFHSALR